MGELAEAAQEFHQGPCVAPIYTVTYSVYLQVCIIILQSDSTKSGLCGIKKER